VVRPPPFEEAAAHKTQASQGAMMTHEKFEGERTLMRIHIGESDKWHGKPLYEAIVELLRKEKFSGATVLRGVGGFGGSSVYHTDKILRLSEDLPIIVEVVDSTDRIEEILPRLDEMVEGGLITLEKVRVILYRAAKK
jgi:PII-like signaling protein